MEDSLQQSLFMLKHFVDDVIVICSSALQPEELLCIRNGWDRQIQVSHDPSEDGKRVSFLDLDLYIRAHVIRFSTYRKPLCSYNYTSFDSCHPSNVKNCIIATEAVRLLRTNDCESSFRSQLGLFRSKLFQRGYCPIHVAKILDRYPWSCRGHILRQSFKSSNRIVPFKIMFCDQAECLRIGATLNKYKYVLGSKAEDLRLLTCFQVPMNLFRLRFDRFLWRDLVWSHWIWLRDGWWVIEKTMFLSLKSLCHCLSLCVYVWVMRVCGCVCVSPLSHHNAPMCLLSLYV